MPYHMYAVAKTKRAHLYSVDEILNEGNFLVIMKNREDAESYVEGRLQKNLKVFKLLLLETF